jgi:hypothetical protein
LYWRICRSELERCNDPFYEWHQVPIILLATK